MLKAQKPHIHFTTFYAGPWDLVCYNKDTYIMKYIECLLLPKTEEISQHFIVSDQ